MKVAPHWSARLGILRGKLTPRLTGMLNSYETSLRVGVAKNAPKAAVDETGPEARFFGCVEN
jgi:hypothetical protein